MVGQGVDEAALGEQGEGAVHRRQTHSHSAVSEPLEELLSSDVVRLSRELSDHVQALPRDAKPAATHASAAADHWSSCTAEGTATRIAS